MGPLQEVQTFGSTLRLLMDIGRMGRVEVFLVMVLRLATDAEWAAWSAAHPGEIATPSGSAQLIEKAKATQEYINKKFLFFF